MLTWMLLQGSKIENITVLHSENSTLSFEDLGFKSIQPTTDTDLCFNTETGQNDNLSDQTKHELKSEYLAFPSEDLISERLALGLPATAAFTDPVQEVSYLWWGDHNRQTVLEYLYEQDKSGDPSVLRSVYSENEL